jgi:hypothetical protein
MPKVRATFTILTGYGWKKAGDEFEVSDKVWAEYYKNGSAVLVQETAPAPEPTPAPPAPAKDKEKASVTITDNTDKEKKQITKP